MVAHEEGLITQYVKQVEALAARAEAGSDVTTEVEAVVAKACEHFRIVKTSDAQANLAAFRGRLKITAEVVHASQRKYKETLNYAASVCPSSLS